MLEEDFDLHALCIAFMSVLQEQQLVMHFTCKDNVAMLECINNNWVSRACMVFLVYLYLPFFVIRNQ